MDKPSIDETYIQSIYSALAAMEVALDADPLVFGPKRLNGKVALCREHLSRCQQIYLQLSNDYQSYRRSLRQAQVDFDLQMQDLFANDPEVRTGRNVRDREAIAGTRLRKEREEIARMEADITDLDAVITVVKAKREDLKDIQGRIRDQVKLCQEEIGLGSRWGSQPAPGERVPNLDAAPRVNPRALEKLNEDGGGLGAPSITDLDLLTKEEEDLADELFLAVEAAPPIPVKAPVEVAPAPVATEAPSPPAPAAKVEVAAVEVPAPPVVVAKEPASETATKVVLPEVTPQVIQSKGTIDDIDSILGELDVPATTKSSGKSARESAATPPLNNEINIDDLLGGI